MTRLRSAKLVVAGGFGVGKTTFIGAVSEIPPLRTEELMTEAAVPHDDGSQVQAKVSTTVAMDFGRITVPDELVLYLFGTPGQSRFAFMWDQIAIGSLAAVILVDTRRVEESFAPIDYFETRGIPFIIAVNVFPDSPTATIEQVRDVLALDAAIPIGFTDALEKSAVQGTLIALVDYLMSKLREKSPTPTEQLSEASSN